VTAEYERVATPDEVVQRASELAARTIVVDVEPFVAWWDSGQELLDSGVARVISELGGLDGVQVLCFATNSVRRPSQVPVGASAQVVYLASAAKPLQIAQYQSLPRPGVVIGDQLLTDGVLARRLGYAFLHYCPASAGMPAGPRLLRYSGWPVLPLVFPKREARITPLRPRRRSS
jgi:predicted HAD superfamily phosphohydrolase YqeG